MKFGLFSYIKFSLMTITLFYKSYNMRFTLHKSNYILKEPHTPFCGIALLPEETVFTARLHTSLAAMTW